MLCVVSTAVPSPCGCIGPTAWVEDRGLGLFCVSISQGASYIDIPQYHTPRSSFQCVSGGTCMWKPGDSCPDSNRVFADLQKNENSEVYCWFRCHFSTFWIHSCARVYRYCGQDPIGRFPPPFIPWSWKGQWQGGELVYDVSQGWCWAMIQIRVLCSQILWPVHTNQVDAESECLFINLI